MIIFYGFLGFACALGATAGFFALRRWGTAPALFGVLLGTAAGGLLFPFPIHSGVTFLGEVLWEEVLQRIDSHEERQEEERDSDFRRSLERRFSGDLRFTLNGRRYGVWEEAVLEDGASAWYDTDSGLVWSNPQAVESWEAGKDLEQGRRFCSARIPVGHWALPTEGELFGFWENEGHLVSPWTGQSTPSVLVDEALRLEVPAWYRGRGDTVAVRCVARSPTAPRAGYLQSDVDPARWNRYQLEKTEVLRGPR